MKLRIKKILPLATRIVSVLLLMAVLVGAMPPKPALADSSTCAQNYTVVAGDTLSSIALKYNVTVVELAAANNLKEPYTIYVGQVLCIPGTTTGGTTPSSSKASFTAEKTRKGIRITATNFPKKSHFFVIVGLGRVLDNKWYKAGKLNFGKNPSATKDFALPKELRKAYYYTVCLKNMVTDQRICKRFTFPK